nr:uridine-cytidine kinase C-like isoform X4 [Tanacetum cinerariifolium]
RILGRKKHTRRKTVRRKWFPMLHRIATIAVVSQHRHTSPPVSHWHRNQGPPSFKVIVDGTYALHAKVGSLLDIRVAVVGGVHFSLLSKVQYDIGDSCLLDNLIDSIFSLFRKHIEPELHHAQN